MDCCHWETGLFFVQPSRLGGDGSVEINYGTRAGATYALPF